MKWKFGLLALALALGLFAAACGGGDGGSAGGGDRLSKDDYVAKVTAVGEKMSGTLEGLGETPADPEAGAEQFAELGEALKGAADELAALNPPEEVQAAHEKFAEGISMLADEISKAGEGMMGGDLGAALTFVSGLAGSEAMKKIQEAAEEFEKAGYDIGG